MGAWTIVIVMGRYAFLAHVAHTYRVRFVHVPRTRYVFRAHVLTCQQVRVGHTDRTCWGSNTYALPEQFVRVGVPARTCCPSRSYALMYQRVRVACAVHTCYFTINLPLCFPLRVKLQDASVRAGKKGPASPGPGEGGEDVEDQRNFLQLAAMEIRDGLVQATTSIEDLRDSLQDARGKETTQGQKTLRALTALRDKYNVQSLQLGKPAEQPGGGSGGGS